MSSYLDVQMPLTQCQRVARSDVSSDLNPNIFLARINPTRRSDVSSNEDEVS